jgi:hypothetical protein
MKFDSTMGQATLALRQATIRLLEKLGTIDMTGRPLGGEFTFSPVTTELSSFRQLASS